MKSNLYFPFPSGSPGLGFQLSERLSSSHQEDYLVLLGLFLIGLGLFLAYLTLRRRQKLQKVRIRDHKDRPPKA